MYLLYAHARISGIVRKSGKDMATLAASGAQLKIGEAHQAHSAIINNMEPCWTLCSLCAFPRAPRPR